uniref:transmembrane protein 154 isoform X1 n=1 Tax=Scatophagus argus TaxID=75038 RepID=UPI001ED825CC|nr:transmembrane protein 154 isoform X1 [Scatophagus argus]
MSASWPGSMRGPPVKTPLLLLLLLPLLLSTLTRTVLCQDEDQEAGTEEKIEGTNDDTGTLEPTAADPDATSALDSTDEGVSVENTIVEENGSGQSRSFPDADISEAVKNLNFTDLNSTQEEGEDEVEEEEEEGLSPVIILIPVVLVVLIISMIVCGIFLNRRWKRQGINEELRKEDPYLDGSSTEKVPMPMFEEDVPSVLELEMEELDQWMKKDGETAEESKQA